jgi:hypothetical protein
MQVEAVEGSEAGQYRAQRVVQYLFTISQVEASEGDEACQCAQPIVWYSITILEVEVGEGF